MTQHTYYTIIIGRSACIVKYTQSPAYEVKLFPGNFESFNQANDQFRQATPGKPVWLTEGHFEQKVNRLAERYKQEVARLQSWLDGKGVNV